MFAVPFPNHRLAPTRIACLLVFLVSTRLVGATEPPITSMVFSPAGDTVLVASQQRITEFRWPGSQPIRQIPSQLDHIHHLEFSPDGRLLAVAGGSPAEEGSVELIAWPSGEPRQRLEAHLDSVMSTQWIDDSTLATGSLDHEVLIWKLGSEAPARRLVGHSKGVTTLGLLRDGKHLISAGMDQNLRVWHWETGQLVRSLNNHTQPVHALAIRPGDHALPMVASASQDKTVRLWQPTIGRMVRFARLPAVPLAIAWLNDGSRMVVACDDGRLRLIDPDTVAVSGEWAATEGWPYSLAVVPDDRSVLVGGSDGLWNVVRLDGADSDH